MFSPASAAVNLGDLTAGTYDLEIQVLGVSARNNTAVNYGKLIVSKEKLQVDFKTQQGINFLNTSLNRLPDNISWLVIDVPDPLTASLVQSFADSLKTIGAVFPLKLPDGEYYLFPNRMYFKVSAFNIGPLTSEQGYRSTNQLIIFRSPENLDALKQYYTDWKSRYKGLYFASLYSIQNNCYFGPYRK